jgi:BlaI family penicillinase repressor
MRPEIIHPYIDSDIHMYQNAAMKTKKVQISAAESQVMEALWCKGPLTPEEVIATTAKANDWGAGTVRTLIARLLRKGFLAGARQEDGYVYKPLVSRADYVGSETQLLLDRLFGGEVTPLVAHFVSAQKLTTADIKKLKKLIREMEK